MRRTRSARARRIASCRCRPHRYTTELLEDICQQEHIRLQVELQVQLQRRAVEGLLHIDCSCIGCLAARLIVELGEQGVSGCQGRLIHLLPCGEMLVGVDALAEQHVEVWVCCSIDLEGGLKLLEEVIPRPDEILSHCLEGACNELQAVLISKCSPQSSVWYLSIP